MELIPGDSAPLKVVAWLGDSVTILDQTQLPHQEVYLELSDYRAVVSAIKDLKVRGAPAIGIAAGYGVALGALKIKAGSRESFLNELETVIQDIASSRPTARNLFWAVERMRRVATAGESVEQIKESLVSEAEKIQAEESEASAKLSHYGAELIPDNAVVLTHCNAGVLATATDYGTALGAVMKASEMGKNIRVLATETRPLLQGARLTAWELMRARIPATVITDAMAGHFLNRGNIGCVMVGADRIASNGDTANKIGTYTLAVLAKENAVPFYVVAPTTTVDLSLASGEDIPIEERDPVEVTHLQGIPITPEGCEALNPAFDVTPHKYISAIITENGIIREPYREGLR
jgi:methylthioribose-1-phosphate isomerase